MSAPVPSQSAQPDAMPGQKSVVSEETRTRWRAMLSAQIGSGKPYDLGQLVESVVGRICDEQSMSISVAAKTMTAVDQMRDVVNAEVSRAKAILDSPGGETLRQPFLGVTVERTEGATGPALKKSQPNSTMNRSHVLKFYKSTPLESPIYTRKMLTTYTDKLVKQQTALDAERVALDTKMKKSLEERTKIVTNLSMVSKELYSLATEVAATLPQKPGGAAKPTTAPVPDQVPTGIPMVNTGGGELPKKNVKAAAGPVNTKMQEPAPVTKR